MTKDFAINNVINVPTGPQVSKKPIYLITLSNPNGTKSGFQKFITLDKPDSQGNFIVTKGIYSDESEENISKNYNEILTSASKDTILEMWFPNHRIISIKSLVFNANKISTLSK